MKKKNNFSVTEAGLIIGLLAAYFAQNLFVFDNLVSYFLFYTVLAYLYSRDTQGEITDKRMISEDVANYVVAPIVAIVFGAMLWYCNVKPIDANLDLINAMQSLNQSPATSLTYFKQVFADDTFGSPEAREQIISMAPSIANASSVDAQVKQDFVTLAYTEMQEQIKETPYDGRYQFFMGVFLDNMSQYQTALPYLQKAVELSPNKLTMMFELAKCYSYLGQKDKALEIAKKAYDLMPGYTDGKDSYAAALILNDQEALAKQIMGTATTTDQNIVRVYLIKASAFVQKGDKQSAAGEIQKAIDIAPIFKTQGETIIKGILDGSLK
jgi:tetratricopeptide (TPR) repeat protein